MEDEPKLSEVLEAVKEGFGLMDEKFVKMDEKFVKMDERFDRLEKRTTGIESGMVTKNYLDEKLGVVSGKISALTNVLLEKHVITEDDKRNIHA